MMILDFLFLPMILFIGTITAYEDSRFGIVRNKWIKIGFFWGVGVLFLMLLYSPFAKSLSHLFFNEILNRPNENRVFTIFPSYLLKQLANAGVAIFVAFFMWKKKVWAAGDAKLFFVFSLLLPLKYYQKSYFPIFPSFVLLVNIFIPIFLYFMTKSAWSLLKVFWVKLGKGLILRDVSLKNIWENASFLDKERIIPLVKTVSLMLLIFMTIKLVPDQFFQKYLLIEAAVFQAAVFILMITFGGKFVEIISQKKVIAPLVILFLYLFVNNPIASNPKEMSLFISQMLFAFLIFMVIFGLLNKIIDFYIEEQGTRKMKREELIKGVFVDDEVIKKLRKDKEFSGEIFESTYLEGLNQKQVEIVKEWLDKEGQKNIKTYLSFPFVSWMFGGVVITFFIQSSLLSFLFPWFFGR